MSYRVLFLVCSVCALSYGDEDDYSFIPNSECSCQHGLVWVNPDTLVNFQCAVFRQGPAELTKEGDPKPADVRTLTCNNCPEPCNAMHCVQSLCVTRVDSGSVSGTASFSLALKAELNTILAAQAEIETTAEFTAGYTSTTEVSTEYCIECGSDAIQPCTGTEYRLYSYEAERDARAPLGHTWFVRIKPWGEPWSEWRPLNTCYGVAEYATIDGFKGTTSGCEATPISCGPCKVCDSR